VCGVPADQVTLIDYEQFCGMPAHDRSLYRSANGAADMPVDEISVTALKARLDAGEDLLILDVRDPHEWEIVALDGTLRIPKGEILAAKNAVLAGRKLREETELIVHCRSGVRSADSIRFLREAGYKNRLLNVRGGILAWADEVDPSLPKY
jgi:adenylyltransferase/sulfurtransferase